MQSPRIFVSHSHKDNEWCRGFVEALQDEGYDAWYDAKGLDGGSQWVLTIQRELQEREVFLIVLTPDAWASDWVQEELQLALTKRRRIIPVLLKQTPVEGFLLNRQWIHVVGMDYATAARRVSASLGTPSAQPASSPNLQPSPQAPTAPAVPTAPAPAPVEASSPPTAASTGNVSQRPPSSGAPVSLPSTPLPSSPSRYPPVSPFPAPPAATPPPPSWAPTRARPASPNITGRRTAIGAGVSMLLVVSIIGGILLTLHNHSGGTTSTQPPPVKGGAIVDALYGEPDSLLPELTGETYSYLVDAAIWDPLLYGDNHGTAQPGILTQVPSASNGGISADLKTYTLHLRPGLKWSNGTALTCDDVKLAADLFTPSDSQGNSLYGSEDGWPYTEIASTTCSDPQTFVVKLNAPDVTFVLVALVDAGTFAPLPVSEFKDYLTHPQDVQHSKFNFQPDITNGPFTIKERVKGDHITLVRNPNYRLAPQGLPYLDQITFQIVPDSIRILSSLQSGTIQATFFADITKYDAYSALSGYKVYSVTGPNYDNIIFNFKNPILADHAVRQALTESLDTSQINQKVYHGLGVATCDTGIGTFAHDPSLLQPGGKTCYKYDPNAAKQLLANDGWQPGSDGFLTYHGTSSSIPQGTKLELKYSTTTNRPIRQETEAIAIQAWAAIGVKIDEIDYVASEFFGAPILGNPNPYSSPGKTRWDIAEFANGGAYDPDDHLYWTCNSTPANAGGNFGYYCDSQVDALEAQQLKEPDQTQRANTFHQIYKLMLTDIPNMFYLSPPTLSVGSLKLHNYNPTAFGPSETWNVADWWLAH